MLEGNYDVPLVLISVLVAVLASYAALALAERVHHVAQGAVRSWVTGGGFAMGSGIWAMHFVGMLAFRLPVPLGYDPQLTLVSWLLPVVASSAALWQVSLPQVTRRHLAISAVLLALGISAMHFVGMAALRMQPAIVWTPWLVVMSVLLALGAAAASLWIAFRLRDSGEQAWRTRTVAALVMGLAIAGMHYTGMAAANFPAGSRSLAVSSVFALTGLALLVIVGTVAVLAIALIMAVFDARLEMRNDILAATVRASDERQALLTRERLARAEVERLSDLKDQFLATLSHELRTPLHAILGWVQLLHLKKDEASLQKGLQTIERNARLQAQLIDDLLDMSRIVAGKVRIEPSWVDFGQVVEAAVEATRPAAFARGIALDVRVAPGTVRVWGDPSRLQQIMWNLLTNAIKFTPEGGQVGVEVETRAGQVLARITDTGSGISPEFLPHVFDRFRQADASTTRRHGGLGLGLAIVRQLVELHGGTVKAESAGEGRGATFTITLPLPQAPTSTDRPEGTDTGPDSIHPVCPVLPDLQGVDVLVVDDEADARQLLTTILQECGAHVRSAEGADDALRQVRATVPDVLVSDIGMPDVDGFELIRRLRASTDRRLTSLPAIALTAFTRAEDRRRALEVGFDRYLRKPVDAGELASMVAAVRR
ncbi:MHYT domain-containing protein [Ramlibacter sp. MMS24-I3-19]|uniref:hybrid sensor histidine kinase/response regulator n=1 Tax=Ramlibacter sp. MMS24-I3-19 TaxID=3416606 RepID=UPI003D067A45